MSYQPDTLTPGLYLPSSPPTGDGFYSPAGLTETPADSNLYAFNVGDFAYPVLEPVPHVEMTLFDLDPSCATVSMFRTVGKRTMQVRGMDHVYAAGGVNVVDWEAPFGVPSTYWAAQYDVDGAFIGNTRPSTTQLDCDETWLTNPLDPAGGVVVELAAGAAASIPRKQDADLVFVDGSGIATATTGQRQGVTGTPIVFYTLTDAATDKVNEILGDPYTGPSGPMIVCIRPAGNLNTRWPQPFIALVDLTEVPYSQPSGGQDTRWEGTGAEVQPPAVVLVGAVLTYEDLDASFPTYEAMDAAFGSYLERDRAYRLAGAADNAPGNGESGPTDPPTPSTQYGSGTYGAGIYGS